jgi:hypothetical protein
MLPVAVHGADLLEMLLARQPLKEVWRLRDHP